MSCERLIEPGKSFSSRLILQNGVFSSNENASKIYGGSTTLYRVDNNFQFYLRQAVINWSVLLLFLLLDYIFVDFAHKYILIFDSLENFRSLRDERFWTCWSYDWKCESIFFSLCFQLQFASSEADATWIALWKFLSEKNHEKSLLKQRRIEAEKSCSFFSNVWIQNVFFDVFFVVHGANLFTRSILGWSPLFILETGEKKAVAFGLLRSLFKTSKGSSSCHFKKTFLSFFAVMHIKYGEYQNKIMNNNTSFAVPLTIILYNIHIYYLLGFRGHETSNDAGGERFLEPGWFDYASAGLWKFKQWFSDLNFKNFSIRKFFARR